MKKGDLVIDKFNQIGVVKVVEDHKPWGNEIHFKLLKDGVFSNKGDIVCVMPHQLDLLLTKEELKLR